MGKLNTVPPNPFPPSSENAGSGSEPYVLPIASDQELGGVIIDGAGLEVGETGLLSVKTGDGLRTNVLGELCADSQKVDYSTAEVDTGVKWVDGKTLYARTFSFVPPKGASVDNTLLCDRGEIETFFIHDGFTLWNYYEMSSPLTVQSFNNMYCNCALVVIENKIYAHTTAHNNVTRMYVTMYYTKSEV